MGFEASSSSSPQGNQTSKDTHCAPCEALSDILRNFPGVRGRSSAEQPSTGTASAHVVDLAEEKGITPQQDCTTCRVLGTSVCAACSAYLAGHMYLAQPASRSHRLGLIAGAALFAGLGVLRATT